MSQFAISKKYTERGFSLLLGALMSVVMLTVAATILNSSFKQTVLSEIAIESERAFHAASAGIECARYWNIADRFDAGSNGGDTVACAGITGIAIDDTSINPNTIGTGSRRPADVTEVAINWSDSPDNPADGSFLEESYRMCTLLTVYKFYHSSQTRNMSNVLPSYPGGPNVSCPGGVECTVVRSKGYNRPCNAINSVRTVERELVLSF